LPHRIAPLTRAPLAARDIFSALETGKRGKFVICLDGATIFRSNLRLHERSWSGPIMPGLLSEKVADCHRRARDARESAERADDEGEELEYLAIERRWLLLAQSFELVERLSDFSTEAQKPTAADSLLEPPSVSPQCPACGKEMQRVRINLAATPAGSVRTRFACTACEVTALHAAPTTRD
jgi:hypothetical protein